MPTGTKQAESRETFRKELLCSSLMLMPRMIEVILAIISDYTCIYRIHKY